MIETKETVINIYNLSKWDISIKLEIDITNKTFKILNKHWYESFIFRRYQQSRDVIELLQEAMNIVYSELDL